MLLPLSVLFATVLSKHLNSEFDIQIRSGYLTTESLDVLKDMKDDFGKLQYKDELHKVFKEARKPLKNYYVSKHPYILNLLDVVEDECISWFESIIENEHEKCLKTRRKLNMKLCKEK